MLRTPTSAAPGSTDVSRPETRTRTEDSAARAAPARRTEDDREGRREAGSVMSVIAMALVGMLAFAALAIDGGYMTATRSQLQHVADAGSLAGITAIRDGMSPAQAIAQARRVAQDARPEAGGEPVVLAPEDIQFGTFEPSSQTFRTGIHGGGFPAVRVVARRASASAGGALEMFFGGITGLPQADAAATSIAAVRRRDVVIVQDRTYSFLDEFAEAIDAELDLVDAMSGSMALAGDRVGVASFGRRAQEEIGLTELSTRKAAIVEAIENMTVCASGTASIRCNGTGTSDAIHAGIDIFERDSLGDDAEKIMLVVTDGVPCYGELPGDKITPGKIDATAAADLALSEGINVYVITLDIDSGLTSCSTPDIAFGHALARGFGYGIATPDPAELDDILVSIVKQRPVRLVQ